MAGSGKKENLENWAFMPRAIREVSDDGDCTFGQWIYRIFCHPLEDDLPLNRLRGVDDLKTRMSSQTTYAQLLQLRNARFQVNPIDSDVWVDGPTRWGLLDRLMFQIPGMDNYGAELHDRVLGNVIKQFDAPSDSTDELNTANYHRWFQNDDTGAMGVKVRRRAFHDENMFAAMNTQENIIPTRLENCYTNDAGYRDCETWEQRWSYAIPLEMIYTTPLQSWNPHNIAYKGFDKTPLGQTVFEGPYGTRRDGSDDPDKAFNGTNSGKFYRIPYQFFEGNEIDVDPADTPSNFVHVLDEDGNVHQVRGSGLRTFLPRIPGVGLVRQRYPIAPLYGDGNPIAKELEALKDIVLHPDRYGFMITNEDAPGGTTSVKRVLDFGTAGHTHNVLLHAGDLVTLGNVGSVDVFSLEANNHQHQLTIVKNDAGVYTYTSCSGQPVCPDGHPPELVLP